MERWIYLGSATGFDYHSEWLAIRLCWRWQGMCGDVALDGPEAQSWCWGCPWSFLSSTRVSPADWSFIAQRNNVNDLDERWVEAQQGWCQSGNLFFRHWIFPFDRLLHCQSYIGFCDKSSDKLMLIGSQLLLLVVSARQLVLSQAKCQYGSIMTNTTLNTLENRNWWEN